MSRYLAGWICAALLAGSCVAQAPKPAPPASGAEARPAASESKDFSQEPAVVERYDTVYRMNADGTGTRVDTSSVRLQNLAGTRMYAVLSMPYLAGTRRVEFVSVRVHKANGATVDTPGAEAQDQAAPASQAAPQFSDLHLALLPVRGLAVGDRLEYRIKTTYTQAEAKDQFWGTESFGRGRVVLERSIELHVPEAKCLQVSSPRYPAKVSDEGGEKVYRWSGSQLRATVTRKTSDQSKADPEEEPDLLDPPIAWTTFRSWAEVGAWYRSLAANTGASSAQLKAKADQVVFGAASPKAKIDALFTFVSREIQSINVPLGQGTWQPHSAADVLANQYGDSKDKSLLLAAMLGSEHLNAAVALVSVARENEPVLPVPGWFGKVVTVVTDPPRGDVWLDIMPEVGAPGVLDVSLRDQTALVIPAVGDPVLRRTPVDLPFPASARFEANGTLSAEGVLKANVHLTLRGDEELSLRQSLHSAGSARWDRVAQSFVQLNGLRGQASNTVTDLPESTGAPLHVSFDLNQAGYGDWENFRVLPTEPALDLPYTGRKSSPERDVLLGGKRTEVAVSNTTLPPGFSADLPPAVHLHTAFADLDKTYKLEATGPTTKLVTERTLAIKESRVPAARWQLYRQFLDQVAESEPWVQLTSASAAAGHRPPNAGENNPKAAALVQQADEAIERRQWADATAKLDQAKALSPHQPFLASSYGAIASATGKQDEAIAAYRSELALHPEEGSVSHRLALDLNAQGKTPEAIEVLKAALALNPQDVQTVALLGGLEEKAAPAMAEKTLRDGLVKAPDSLELKLMLGKLLLTEGKRDEGVTLLTAVCNGSEIPGELNDAAYSLAEAGVGLPVAELATRRAIQLLNAASVRGDSDGRGGDGLRRTLQLVSTWDTYGWVLFKEGNTSEAEPWLRAAWADGYGAEAGRHLAQLLQKEGNAAEVARLLHAAGAQAPNVKNGDSGSEAVTTARTGGTRNASVRPGAASEADHGFSVSRSGAGPAGTALFQLVSALNLPTVAHFVEGDRPLAGMEEAVGKVDTHTLLPPGSPVQVTRLGVLHCGSGSACRLEILSAQAALSR